MRRVERLLAGALWTTAVEHVERQLWVALGQVSWKQLFGR
jgi:hypothetical protein